MTIRQKKMEKKKKKKKIMEYNQYGKLVNSYHHSVLRHAYPNKHDKVEW